MNGSDDRGDMAKIRHYGLAGNLPRRRIKRVYQNVAYIADYHSDAELRLEAAKTLAKIARDDDRYLAERNREEIQREMIRVRGLPKFQMPPPAPEPEKPEHEPDIIEGTATPTDEPHPNVLAAMEDMLRQYGRPEVNSEA